MKYFKEHSVVKHGIDPSEADIEIGGEIVVGKFIDIDKPTYGDSWRDLVEKAKK